MRNLLVIGVLLVAAFMAGWFQINRDGERTTIEINRSEIRSDARRAINRGRDFLERQEQEYAQGYDQQNQPLWPTEQVAAQQDQWGQVHQQSYQAPAYQDAPYQQDQRYPNPQPQAHPYQQQPYYPPVTR